MGAELDRVRSGQPRVLWLSGPAGVGKTSLVRRLLADQTGVCVLRGSGEEGETGLPFGVVAQLVADVPPRLRRPLLAAGPAPDADPLAVGAELLTVLGALQAAGPVVVVVDDAQWVDEASGRALVFVGRRLRRDQVLVVVAARDDTPPEAAWWERGLTQDHLVHRVRLRGLDAEEIVALAGALGGPALSPEAGRRLRDHTDGHPLHAAALLAELPAEALTDTSRILPAPRSFAALVLVRVAKLTPPAQDLVVAAAVLGRRCALSDVVALAAAPDPLPALDEAVRARLLDEVLTGTTHHVAFPHELVRAAVYADLAPARRHALHRAAAALLGGAAGMDHRVAAAVGPDPALAAELAALGRAEAAARRWPQAADRLMAAADLSGTADDRAARLVLAVGAMLAGGELGRALRVEPDLRAGPPTPGLGHVLGRLEALTGRFDAARETLTAALHTAEGDPGGRAVAAAHLALVSLVEGDAGPAAALAADSDAPAEVAALARFVHVLGLAVQGRHDEAHQELARRRAGSDLAEAEEARAMSGILALWSDDAAGAAATLAAVGRPGAPPMSVQGRIMVLGHLGEAQYRLGDWDAAAANGALAVSLVRDAGVLLGAGVANALAAHVEAGRGAWETADERAATAGLAAELLPWWGARAHAATATAVVAQARGDHAAMLHALTAYDDPAVHDPVDRVGVLPWRALRVEALLGLGRTDEAHAALTDLEERVARRRPGWSALEAARLRCELTETHATPTAVRAAYERAAALAETVPAALSRARLEIAHGRYLLALGERRPAVDLLRSAHARLGRLGAVPFLDRCDALLRAAGLHQPATGGALELTSQELAVARLVAEGRTNQEAGAALFVTGRTVAFHLSNIYAKLGVSSRRELAALLARHPTGRSAGRS
jgi:DNA-binding CsgD family transcriptional regulator